MGSDARKIFDGCNFMLDLGRMPYLKKKDLREKILHKGGNVVYSVNKKTDFVVINSIPEDESIWPFSLITATKFDVKIVYPSYIDVCLETGKLVKEGINPHLGNHVTNAFNQGRILGFNGKRSEKLERKKQMDKSSQTTVWKFMDPNGPSFHAGNYEIAKFVILKGHQRASTEVSFCSLEIHIKITENDTDAENSPKFCVFWHVGVLSIGKKDGSGLKNCRYTDSSDSALSIFNKLFAIYTNPPYNFTKGHPQCPADVAVGSPKLQEIWDEQNVDVGKLDADVGDLMTHIWKEAVGDIEAHLAVPVNKITENDVEKAEAILRLIRAAEKKDDDQGIKLLKFTQLIPLRNQQLLQTKIGIAQVFEMLQLIRDVISVNESASSGKKLDRVTQYKSLRCFVQHHPSHTEEFANVNRIVVESSKIPVIVKNIYTVRRNVENVDFTHGLVKKRLMFHGSEVKNFVGILSRGLILPSQFTTVRGEDRSDAGFLGQGIYFSPSASTSANYSKPSSAKGTRLMLLAEVALGETYQTRSPGDWVSPPEGYNSVHGVGANDMEPSAFEEDEFAIFSVSQQRLKYLIEFNLPGDGEVKILEMEDYHMPALVKVDDTTPATYSSDIMEKLLYPEPKETPVVGLVSGGFAFPLKDLKISARLIDLAGQVCIFQMYENPREHPLEAKYVFPLDDMAAVCGFEAYINDKHIVGEVKEKKQARREYVVAISEGHGAYLMDEERPNIFVVSVGNLPAKAKVLIKITYVTELNVERGQILFHLPGNVSVQQHKIELPKANQSLESVFGESESNVVFSIVAYIEMPFDIMAISCPTHNIHTKKTATKAMVKVADGSRLGEGFQLLITLSKMHVPRMWVEESSSDDMPEACMLTFYPNFDVQDAVDSTMIIFIDASHSMSGNNCRTAQQIALLCLRHLPNDCKFNIVIFGTAYSELFIAPQLKTQETEHKAQEFIMQANGDWGNSELLRATLSTFLLPPESKKLQNLFVISDGFLNNVGGILRNAKRFHGDTRIFTFGVGSTCNSHLLKTLAVKGAGACEIFEKTTMSTWEKKVKGQISKAMRPVLTDVRVEWQQMNDLKVSQAPKQLVSLFSGERQVVYGFVPNCSMATLKANLNGMEISTVVSASRVEKTSGEILHRLTARAIIRDYEYGNLDDDCVTHEVQKQELDEHILELSKRFNLVTLRTSFIAVERRNKGEVSHAKGPNIDELFAVEAEDALAYISYEGDHQVPRDEGKNDKDTSATEVDMNRVSELRPRTLMKYRPDVVRRLQTFNMADYEISRISTDSGHQDSGILNLGYSRDDGKYDEDDDDEKTIATETSETESDEGTSDEDFRREVLKRKCMPMYGGGYGVRPSTIDVCDGAGAETTTRFPDQMPIEECEIPDDASTTEDSEAESDEEVMGFGIFDEVAPSERLVKRKLVGKIHFPKSSGEVPASSDTVADGSSHPQVPLTATDTHSADVQSAPSSDTASESARIECMKLESLLMQQAPRLLATSFGSGWADITRSPAFGIPQAPLPHKHVEPVRLHAENVHNMNNFGSSAVGSSLFGQKSYGHQTPSFGAVTPGITRSPAFANQASGLMFGASPFMQQAPLQSMASRTFGFSPQFAKPPSPEPQFQDVSFEEMRVAEKPAAHDVLDGIVQDSVQGGLQTDGITISAFGSPNLRKTPSLPTPPRPQPSPPSCRPPPNGSLLRKSLATSTMHYVCPPPPPHLNMLSKHSIRLQRQAAPADYFACSELDYYASPPVHPIEPTHMEVEEKSDDSEQESSIDVFKLLAAGPVGNSLGGIPLCTEILKQLAVGLDISDGLRQIILQVQNLDCSKADLSKLMAQIEDVQGKDSCREDFKFDSNLQTGSLRLKADHKDYQCYSTYLEEIVSVLKQDGLNSLGSEAAAVIVDLITTILCFSLMVLWDEKASEKNYTYVDITSIKSTATFISQLILKGGSSHKWWVDILKGLLFVSWANRRYPLAYQSIGLSGNWETIIEKCIELHNIRHKEMSC